MAVKHSQPTAEPKSAPVVMKEEQAVSRVPRYQLSMNQITEIKRALQISGADSYSQIQTFEKIKSIVEV